jgi:shikimate kinase
MPAKAAGVRVVGGKSAAKRSQTPALAVVLIGFMGAGKSSVGRALGEFLGWPFEDLDARIELREGRKVPEIFRDSGEAAFRRAEQTALKELVGEFRDGTGRILALGGGAFAQRQNARLIAGIGVPSVFLDADVMELWQRCIKQAEQDGIERPLLGSLETFRKLYEARRPHYLKASFRQQTGGNTVERIAAEVAQALGLKRSRTKRREKKRGEKH